MLNLALTGHFKLSSGRHSSTYFQNALLDRNPRLQWDVTEEFLSRHLWEVDLVAAPAVGALLFAHTIALQLKVGMVYSERVNGVMTFKRFTIKPGDRVLVVEDVVTTGLTTREISKLVEDAGGVVVDVACLVSRNPLNPVKAYVTLETPSWEPEGCPLCLEGVELTTPGSRFQ